MIIWESCIKKEEKITIIFSIICPKMNLSASFWYQMRQINRKWGRKNYFVINFTALTFRHLVLHTYRYHIIQCRMTCAIYRCRMFTIIPFCAKRVILLTATPDLSATCSRVIFFSILRLLKSFAISLAISSGLSWR